MNKRLWKLLLGTTATSLFALSSLTVSAKENGPGVTDAEIKIGNIIPYSGPASVYGAIGKAIKAYFDKVNAEGGINGRKLNFVSLDDGYNPAKTVEAARKLVSAEEVLLVFQTLGTPTNSAIHKYMNAKKVPHLFIASGASKWDDPKNYPWSMGWQPSYPSEARIYAKHILKNNPNAKIAVLYQNDDYGKDYLNGFKDGLGAKADSMIVSTQTYESADPSIDSQIVSLKSSGADTFLNISGPKHAAQGIRKIRDIQWKMTHYLNSVSNSVGSVMKPAGFDNAVGIYSAFYLKDPNDPQWKDDAGYKEWDAWMDKYNKGADKTSSFNVYGYSAAQTLVKVLTACGDDLSRENVMKQAASMDFELPLLLPGVRVQTGPNDFSPVEDMQLGQFDGKVWVLTGEVIRK